MAISHPAQLSKEEDRVPRGPVTATLNFYAPSPDGAAPFNHVDTPPAGLSVRNFSDSPQQVQITDIRGSESDFTLDGDAFQVLSSVPTSPSVDFTSEDSITTHYYPEITSLLLSAIPGSTNVLIFDHTIRRTSPSSPRNPVQRVHIDQTPYSAAQRVKRHITSSSADRILSGVRYRIVNVWRPLNKTPVESFPLAFASSSSLDDKDIIPVEHRYASGYLGQTAAIQHNPDQKWYYLSGMTGDERLLLECFDSEALMDGSGVQGGRVAHTAFADPRSRPDAEGRESIEVRALVFGP
ncbi:methyltransferase [Podospora didyma]|uniref:Methyltransferase n=1 Tax=Podospora didyma TaxID=330526 RepID=A0AAE0U1F7_9PEZI|nr:methyltransferase [Podospora didyma]